MSFGNGVGGSFTALEAVLSIVFCALVMHGLKTSNPKMILPSLVFIPINTTAVMFEMAVIWDYLGHYLEQPQRELLLQQRLLLQDFLPQQSCYSCCYL